MILSQTCLSYAFRRKGSIIENILTVLSVYVATYPIGENICIHVPAIQVLK